MGPPLFSGIILCSCIKLLPDLHLNLITGTGQFLIKCRNALFAEG